MIQTKQCLNNKKNHIFTVRFDDDFNIALRRLANNHGVSCGSVIRRVVRSYLISKGLYK